MGKLKMGVPGTETYPKKIWEKKKDNVILVVDKQTCKFRDKEAFDWVLGVAVDFLNNVIIFWKHYHWYLKKIIWFLVDFSMCWHEKNLDERGQG